MYLVDQWRAFTSNESGESDASIYAKRLGLEDGVLANYLAGNTRMTGTIVLYQSGLYSEYFRSR